MSEADAGKADAGKAAGSGKREAPAPQPLVCDFCGATVPRVRRVALDRDYDRLQTPHTVRYACESCSEAKERRRLGLDPAG